MKIENRTFVISGGSSGLGLATAIKLCQSGAYVAVVDIQDIPKEATNDISSIQFFKADLTIHNEVSEAVNQIVLWIKETGAHLGGVINCAGVAVAQKIVSSDGTPHSLDLFEFALSLNVTGTFNLTRCCLPHLIKVEPESEDGERGIIIMVASAAAYEGQPGQVAYAASKGAIRSMTLPMARDLGRYGIRVNTIAPSLFVSPMTDKMNEKVKDSLIKDVVFPKRFGETSEFADMALFLIQSSYVNGENFRLSAAGRMPGRL